MRNLSLGDNVQKEISIHLEETEMLLAKAASKASGKKQDAEIVLMPDLGLANNIRRMFGGFYTGAFYQWSGNSPIVPVDATINVCGVSVYKVSEQIDSEAEFRNRIEKARDQLDTYLWNFQSGNHFITYGRVSTNSALPIGNYLVLHASASEFKRQRDGLYPSHRSWFRGQIESVSLDNGSIRQLRFIRGQDADLFYEKAKLEDYNATRHRYIAQQMFGSGKVEAAIPYRSHYGMPDQNCVAIGCQWMIEDGLFLLLTAPNQPLLLIETKASNENLVTTNHSDYKLYPHGLGKTSNAALKIKYGKEDLIINGSRQDADGSLEGDDRFSIRGSGDNLSEIVTKVLHKCPGRITAQIMPIYSCSRYSISAG